MRLLILISMALLIPISMATAADTQVAINLNLKSNSNIDDANLTFHAQNATERMAIKANQGDIISKQANLNITAPYQWEATLTTVNGTKILDLNGVAGLNWARFETTYLDERYLGIEEDTPAVIITAQAVEARLTPTVTLKDYSSTLSIDVYLDSNGNNMFEDYEHSSKKVKPTGNVVEVEFPPFASATQTARYMVNISDGSEQVALLSGTYNFRQAVAVSDGETYIDSNKITSAALGVEYRIGTIVINLPNDAFAKTKGNITAVSANYLEISLKSNKTSVVSNISGQLSAVVISNATKLPIENAFISIYNEGNLINSTHTDKDGSVKFNLVPDQYEIMVQKGGYQDADINYTVGFKPSRVVFYLEKLPTTLDKISGMVRSALTNPMISVVALLAAVVAIVAASWKRR